MNSQITATVLIFSLKAVTLLFTSRSDFVCSFIYDVKRMRIYVSWKYARGLVVFRLDRMIIAYYQNFIGLLEQIMDAGAAMYVYKEIRIFLVFVWKLFRSFRLINC